MSTKKDELMHTNDNGTGLSDPSSPYQDDPFMPDDNPMPESVTPVSHETALIPRPELAPQLNPQALTFEVPRDTPIEKRRIMLKFKGSKATPLWDQVGNWLEVDGVIAFAGYKHDKDGNPVLDEEGACVPTFYTFWHTVHNQVFHSQSMVVYSWCRDTLWPIFTLDNEPGMLIEPVRLRIKQRRTINGNMTFDFEIG